MRFPILERRGLGVGLDLPWNGATGFGNGDVLAPSVKSFLKARSRSWSHAFFCGSRAIARFRRWTTMRELGTI